MAAPGRHDDNVPEFIEPTSTFLDDSHIHIWANQARITFERFRETSDGLKAEITVESAMAPRTGVVLGPSMLNLLSERTISTTAKQLREQVGGIDWWDALGTAARLSVQAWREGDQMVRLDPQTVDWETPEWLYEPFMEEDSIASLYAPGGSGKGYVALLLAVSVASGVPLLGGTVHRKGPVAYLDWEASKDATERRIARICEGAGITTRPPIWYRRETAPLESSVAHLAKQVRRIGAALVVVDSKGMAVRGAPEGAEGNLGMLQAVRKLGAPALVIDHVSKSTIAGDSADMQYGSVYAWNETRVAWSMRSEWKPGELRVSMINRKRNEGPLAPQQNFTLTFAGRQVAVLGGEPVLPSDASLIDRICDLLADGPVDVRDIADHVGASRDSVRKLLSRHADRVVKTRLGWELTQNENGRARLEIPENII